MNGEWISVSERLPPPGFPVLILTFFRALDGVGCEGRGGLMTVAAVDRIDGRYLWTSEYGDETPTHWMPLPEPPSDGQSESARRCKLVLLTDEELKAIEASKNFFCHECETDLAQDDDYRWAEALRLLIDRLG